MTEATITLAEFEERLGALCGTSARAAFPRKARDRHILLRSIVQTLDAAKRYSELTINDGLKQWLMNVAGGIDVDHVALRRYLVDEGYLHRDAAGRSYGVRPEGNGQIGFDRTIEGSDPVAIVLSARDRAAARKAARSTTGRQPESA